MFEKFKEKFLTFAKSKDIRSKIFFSILVIVILRALASIPVVGITTEMFESFFDGTGFGDLLSTMGGGVLETASVIAIGIGPYINASIMLQLLTSVIPKLEELRNEGTEGRRKISMYTRFLTVPLAILQAFVIYTTIVPTGTDLSSLQLIAMIATLTGGAMFAMWLGELISEDGLGGGSGTIIFLGIIAGMPTAVTQNMLTMDPLQKFVFILVFVLMLAAVIFVNEGERRIKVNYSRRAKSTGGAFDSFIPLKLTQSGVMPVIFAMSLLSFPQMIGQFLVSKNIDGWFTNAMTWVMDALANPWVENIGTVVMIVLFSFFYVTVVFNTDELSENLQKQGAFIPGIRPGKATAKYLRKTSFRLTAVGATFLAILSILPNLLIYAGVIQSAFVTGTGLLILVGVVLEIKRQIESMVVTRSYDKYI